MPESKAKLMESLTKLRNSLGIFRVTYWLTPSDKARHDELYKGSESAEIERNRKEQK